MVIVSVHEAATRLGVSQDTIRRRIRKDELQATQSPTPQGYTWMVELPDDEEGPDGQRKYSTGEVLAFGELVGVLKDAVTALRGQLEAREREVRELHFLLQKTHPGLTSPGQPAPPYHR